MNIHRHNSSGENDDYSIPDELEEGLEDYRISENNKLSLSDSEVERALDKVLDQVDEEEAEESETDRSFTFNWKLMSIAATITFIGMLFALSIPVSVEVPNGELATVNLPDGTSITLNSGSELSYSRFYNYFGRNVTLNGEGFFDVYSNADDPFTVNTLNSSIKVLGTKFNLSDWNSETGAKAKLAVTEGSVQFADLNSKDSIVLSANEGAMITQTREIITSPVELEKTLAWTSNNIAFQNENLGQAFGMLERRFDLTIELGNKLPLKDESITAFYHYPVDPESIIRDICTIKGLGYQKTHNGFKITSN